VLYALHAAWAPGGAFREAFFESQPEIGTGLSRAMVQWALDRFADRIDPARASERAALQFANARCTGATVLRAEPLGALLLVVSGNVFTGPAEGLLAALFTRNAAIVKRPSAGGEFVDLFFASLHETAPDLAAAAALAAWKGGTEAIERPLAEGVDGIVVAGDSDTIAAYRRLAPSTTPLVEFGPRVSVAVVSHRGIDALDVDRLARDVALWDQFACSAAQSVYVEAEDAARATAARLAEALARLERTLPAGHATLDERVEVARLRHEAAFAETQDAARLFPVDGALATVVFERDAVFRASPLRRSVRVKPYRSLDELAIALEPARHLLHTIGLAIGANERSQYEERLAAAGARRLCNIGAMNEPSAVGSHDGVLELQRLVRWVECAR
jgi:long-chain-fatty-acyl-CoA reductase